MSGSAVGRALAGAAVLAATVVAAAAPPASAHGPYTTTFGLESQSWWFDDLTETEGTSSHAHSAMNVPLYQSVSGVKTFTVTSTVHNEEPGTVVDTVRIQAGYGGGTTLASNTTDRACAGTTAANCTVSTSLTIDFGTVRRGLVELRVHTHTRRPDGTTATNGSMNLATSGWWVYNAGPTTAVGTSPDTSSGTKFPQLAARGRWNTITGSQLGYEVSSLRSMIPSKPVCGIWRFRPHTFVGENGSPVTYSLVTRNPNFHAGVKGSVLLEKNSGTSEYVSLNTVGLTNSTHQIVVVARAEVSEPEHPNARLAGVLRFPVTVANGDITCTPQPAVEMSWPDGATVNGISGTSSDALLDAVVPAGTTSVKYLLDGVQIASDSTSPDFDESGDVSTWTNGPHTLVARATTPSGVIDSPAVHFTVSN